MKKAGRALFFAVGGILAVLAVALLAVNLYVQSHHTQQRIQNELSARLNATLRIQRISVTPWWGLKLTGITMPQVEPGASGDFLRAETFRLRINFRSLFTGNLVIKEIALVRPNVSWKQNAAGKWRLPMLRDEESEQTAPAAAATGEPNVAAIPPPPIDATPPATTAPPPPSGPRGSDYSPEIRRVALLDGSFHFVDNKTRPVATFEGVTFRSNFRSAAELRGLATIRRVSLRDRFFLRDLKSPLRYDSDELELSDISAHAGGGDITGEFRMLQSEVKSPFVAKVNFRDVQVDRVVSDAGGPTGMLQGRIEGNLNASGNTADPNALAGSGEIYLRDGEVRRYAVLVALGQLLQLDELSQLKLEQAQVKYRIAPGTVMIDELLLNSTNLRLSATGTIGFDGKLKLDFQLAIHDRIRDQLFRPVRNNFQRMEESAYSSVTFKVTGTLERPKTNLMGKLIGHELKDLSGLLNSFLGGDKPAARAKEEPAPPNEFIPAQPEAAPQPTASP